PKLAALNTVNCVVVAIDSELLTCGKVNSDEPPPVPHALAFAETVPSAATCKQRMPVPPVFEITRLVVLATPGLLTVKSVEVAVPPVVDAMRKSMVGAPKPLVEVAVMESCAYGEVVPRPKLPLPINRAASMPPVEKPMKLVPLPPKMPVLELFLNENA